MLACYLVYSVIVLACYLVYRDRLRHIRELTDPKYPFIPPKDHISWAFMLLHCYLARKSIIMRKVITNSIFLWYFFSLEGMDNDYFSSHCLLLNHFFREPPSPLIMKNQVLSPPWHHLLTASLDCRIRKYNPICTEESHETVNACTCTSYLVHDNCFNKRIKKINQVNQQFYTEVKIT